MPYGHGVGVTPMRRRVLFLPLWGLLVIGGAISAGADPSTLNMSVLYEDELEVAVDYGVAMSLYRRLKEPPLSTDVEGFPLIPLGERLPRVPYTWFASDGSVLTRMKEGHFRVLSSTRPGEWHATLDCYLVGWPELFCIDGRQREISAPDLDTVILGERTYARSVR